MTHQIEQGLVAGEENLPELPLREKIWIGFLYLAALNGHVGVNVDAVIRERRLELAEKAKKQAAADQAYIEELELLAEDGFDPQAQLAAQAELDRRKNKQGK